MAKFQFLLRERSAITTYYMLLPWNFLQPTLPVTVTDQQVIEFISDLVI